MTVSQLDLARERGNFPSGFHGFVAHIDAVTEAMKGDDKLRECIAKEFSDQLQRVMNDLRKPQWPNRLPWNLFWTMATSEEFDKTCSDMERILRWRTVNGIVAKGEYRGMEVVQRGDGDNCIYIEGGGYGLRIAMRFEDEHAKYGREKNYEKRPDVWRISINDHAETLRGSMPSLPTLVTTYSEKKADQALREIVKRHLGIDMKVEQ